MVTMTHAGNGNFPTTAIQKQGSFPGSGKVLQKSLTEQVQDQLSEGNAKLRHLGGSIISLTNALEATQVSLMRHVAWRGLDAEAALQSASQRLAALLADETAVV